MRNLTITRAKVFPGCLGTMKVYIEDPAANELTINGTACRKLGTLKNGETQTFSIGENSANLYIIADKVSKDLFNEVYPIPDGQEDITLSGKCHLAPCSGNILRFDDATAEQTLTNRKKVRDKGLIIFGVSCAAVLLAIFLLAQIFLVGWFLNQSLFAVETPTTFSENGMEITLTDSFQSTSQRGYTNCYESKNVAILALKEPFSKASGFSSYSLTKYTRLVIQANRIDSSTKVYMHGDWMYFEYQANGYTYFTTTHKANDAFWVIQFACKDQQYEDQKSNFMDWADTIRFNGSQS